MAAPVNWADPCARFLALQKAYFTLVSGGQVAKVSYLSNGVQRSSEFSLNSMDTLKIEMQNAQSQCCVAIGLPDPNRRFAISAGAHRRRRPMGGFFQ